MLLLENLKDMTAEQLTDHLVREWEVLPSLLAEYEVLIGYEGDGCYEGAGFFLLRLKETGALFSVHASHCSCYGFEGQFEPEESPIEYLTSPKFRVYTCGDNDDTSESAIREFIAQIAKVH